MSATARGIVTGSTFLIIFISSVWLSRTGRPFNVGISTIHKLISLAAALFLLVTFYQASRVAALSAVALGAGELTAVVVTGSVFLGSGISGALLSGDKPALTAVLRVHQILPVFTVLSSAIALYLLGAL